MSGFPGIAPDAKIQIRPYPRRDRRARIDYPTSHPGQLARFYGTLAYWPARRVLRAYLCQDATAQDLTDAAHWLSPRAAVRRGRFSDIWLEEPTKAGPRWALGIGRRIDEGEAFGEIVGDVELDLLEQQLNASIRTAQH